jgi:purine catabolism regulator
VGPIRRLARYREDEIALTLRALLRLAPLCDATVLTGEAGLEREVSWPATLRVRPPAFEPLSGHELALVSIDALRLLDESLSLAQLIGRLAERGVSGIVVVGTPDEVAIQRAAQADLPLLQLPASHHLADLGPTISRVIAEQRTRLYQLGLEAQQQLAAVSMDGRGLGGIVERLSEVAGREAILWNASGEIVHTAPVRGRTDREIDRAGGGAAGLLGRLRDGFETGGDARGEPATARLAWGDGVALAAPVAVRDDVVGYLMLVAEIDDFGEDDQVVLARGSLVCALELAKQEAVTEAERRLRGDFFDDLLGNGIGHESTEALITRGRHLGYDLQRTYTALSIAPDRIDLVESPRGSTIERLAREVSEYLTGRGAAGLVAQRRHAVALFLVNESPGDPNPARRFAENLREYLIGPVGLSVSIGLGSYHPGIAGLRIAYQEAEQAGQIGREFFGPGQVTAFGDLGVYRLLYAFRQSSELAAFCEETLAPLVDYDAKNGSTLVETLDVFFRCDASLRSAADALFLHRNSLAYRLRRVTEITGLNLDNLEDRLRLQLALKGRRLVRAQQVTTSGAQVGWSS